MTNVTSQANTAEPGTISGESFFDPFPEQYHLIEQDFVPFDQSIVWDFNQVFWQHTALWERTYGEHFETSLPSGQSESHHPEFIEQSARRFYEFLCRLKKNNQLPEKIVVLEQGPGTGYYAQGFLNWLQRLSPRNYDVITYILSDTSDELLENLKETLSDHSDHLVFYKQKTPYDIPDKYTGQVLFLRHSNMWDQLPCRLLSVKNGKLYERYTRAVLDKNIDSVLAAAQLPVESTIASIRTNLEAFILKNPTLWKPIIKCLKLEEQPVEITEGSAFPYADLLLSLEHPNTDIQVMWNYGALENLSQSLPLVDWDRGGYIEVLDVIVPNQADFEKPRDPRKFDGALAVIVNGPLIRAYLNQQQKHLALKKIKGLNHLVTIRERSLRVLLEHKEFVKIAEIAPNRDKDSDALIAETQTMYQLGIDVVLFSDQAGGNSKFFSLDELAAANCFSKLPGRAVVPVLAARRKNPDTMAALKANLKQQGVENLFIVTGDPSPSDSSLTALDLIPQFSGDFYTGAVAHPQVGDIPKTLQKLEHGVQFLIVQVSYDQDEWQRWFEEIKKQRIQERVPIIFSILPITSRNMLAIIDSLPDISLSNEVLQAFDRLENDGEIRKKGIALARTMIQDYTAMNFFSGMYIFTKSQNVLAELLR